MGNSSDLGHRGRGRAALLPWLVLAVSLTATAATSWYVHTTSRARDQARFDNAVQATADRIHTRLEVYVNVLRGGASMVDADGELPAREKFQRYVDRLRLTAFYPGIQGVGLTLRVPAAEKEDFERRMRNDVSPSFRIWPEQPRAEYHAIVYLEPLDRRNRAAIGYDMFTNPVRRAAMSAARDTGERAATGKVVLVQEIDPNKQAGFLIYVPIYRGGGVPATVAERRERLLGFVYAPFRAGDLFHNLFGTEAAPRTAIDVYDGARIDPGALLHRSARPRHDPLFTAVVPFDAAGRRWTIRYQSLPQFEAASSAGLVAPLAGAGAALSLVLFLIVRALQRSRWHAEQTALRLRESESHLRTETEILETLNTIGRIVSAELDLDKLVQAVTDAATQLCGAQFGAFFYTVVDQQGESFTLYSISGVPREAFSRFPMPRNTDLFGPTFRGEAVVRSYDIRTDPRYGRNPPYHGMPAGHLPVVSYLAVPVVSRSGRTIGGLFFGHERPGVFTARHEKIISGVATQAAVAMDNARLYQQAQQANRAKDEFLATLSHELRTPMTAILGWSRLLALGDLDDAARAEAAEAIHRSAETQAKLIDDVLDVSRVVTGNLRLQIASVEASAIVHAAIGTVRHTAEAKGVVIEVDAGAGTGLQGDASRLQQVVWNLLTNAIRFTPPGGKISVVVDRVDEGVRIVVSDTGKGISPAFLRHLFEPFRQEDSGTTREHGGLGLGLSIVRYLVELHGGTIRAESAGPGSGATFTVVLPVTASSGDAKQASPSPVATPAVDRLPRLDGKAVLVVDDSNASREVVAATLATCGANVLTASTADEGEALLRWNTVHAVVCDIAMPARDGYSFVRAVRADPVRARLPVIALTAFGRPEDRAQALAAGFDDFLQKPIDPVLLATAVAAHLDGTRGRDAGLVTDATSAP